MENEELISAVFSRKPLWDMSSSQLCQRDLVRKLWDEVANALDSDRDTVKKRWKSLKDNYRKELKKVTQIPESESGTPCIKPKWALFESLHFLRNVIGPGNQFGHLRHLPPCTSVTNNAASQEDTPDNITIENVSCEAENGNFQKAETTNFGRNSIKRKRKHNFFKNIFVEMEKEKLGILEEDRELKKDGNYNFLMSFLPHMKSMSELGNLRFRAQMSEILLQIKENDKQLAYSQTAAAASSWESSCCSFNNL